MLELTPTHNNRAQEHAHARDCALTVPNGSAADEGDQSLSRLSPAHSPRHGRLNRTPSNSRAASTAVQNRSAPPNANFQAAVESGKTLASRTAEMTRHLSQLLSLSESDRSYVLNLTMMLTHVLDASREGTVLTDFDHPNASKVVLPLIVSALLIGHGSTLLSALKSKEPAQTPTAPTEQAQDNHSNDTTQSQPDNNQRRVNLQGALKTLSVASKVVSYYANPAKSAATDAALATAALAGKAPVERVRTLRHLAPIALVAINLASMSRMRYLGTAIDMMKQPKPMQGAHEGHPLQPTKLANLTTGANETASFRHMPHNAGASIAYTRDAFSDFAQSILANHRDSLTHQLEQGARALMLDAKADPERGGVRSCHETLDYGPFADRLAEIGNFLRQPENKDERVMLLIENVNSITIEEFTDVFKQANVFDMLPTDLRAWQPGHMDDPAFSDHQLFPVITRTWAQQNNTVIEPGFAYAVKVTGDDQAAYNNSQSLRPGWWTTPMVVVLETDWNNMLPDAKECPLSCQPITDLACIEIINHFSPVPAPEIFTQLSQSIKAHVENCDNNNPDRNLFVSFDHSQNL